MVCKHCGATIEENMDYCMACGESVEEQIIIKSVKELPKEAQPALDFSGYVKSLVKEPYNSIALIGAICLYLSPFFAWVSKTFYDNKTTGDLFDIAAKNGDFGIDKGILSLYGTLILVAGVMMLLMSARDYIKFLKPVSENIIVRLVPSVLAIIVFVLILGNNDYTTLVKLCGIKVHNCVGPILLVVGVLIYTISVIMERNKRD